MNIEPNADMRVMATNLYQMYQALVQVGFTDAQAMQVLGTCLASSIQAGGAQ